MRNNFYPRSPCGERHLRVLDGSKSSIISIHALLAESDVLGIQHKVGEFISIHALLAESDGRITSNGTKKLNFYPRSPCGERPAFDVLAVSALLISIHALLAESDGISLTLIIGFLGFLSTLSLRRATVLPEPCGPQNTNFYPRSPCGERRSQAL